MDSQITQLKDDIVRTEDSFKNNKPIKDEIHQVEDNKKIIEGKIVALERITVDRGKWVRLMEISASGCPISRGWCRVKKKIRPFWLKEDIFFSRSRQFYDPAFRKQLHQNGGPVGDRTKRTLQRRFLLLFLQVECRVELDKASLV